MVFNLKAERNALVPLFVPPGFCGHSPVKGIASRGETAEPLEHEKRDAERIGPSKLGSELSSKHQA